MATAIQTGDTPESASGSASAQESSGACALYLDIGNHRLKWLWANQAGAAAIKGDLGLCLDRVFGEKISRVAKVRVALGEGHRAFRQLKTALQDRVPDADLIGVTPRSINKDPCRLVLAYSQPQALGADRWCAMLASRLRHPREDLIIIDAGSACTIDLVDRQGEHLGGYILPGMAQMMANCGALADSEIALQEIIPQGPAALPGRSTGACILEGAGTAFAAGVAQLRHGAQALLSIRNKESGLGAEAGAAKTILTGGEAAFLETAINGLDANIIPGLVIEGLRALDGSG